MEKINWTFFIFYCSFFVQVFSAVCIPSSCIDGQVHLVCLIHLQTDNFRLFLRQQMTNFRLHNVQTANGLRKKFPVLPFSVFGLEWQHIYTHIYIDIDIFIFIYLLQYWYIYMLPFQYIYIYIRKTEQTENGSFYFLQTENAKQKFVFFGQKTVNDNRLLMFQQTCPSMQFSPTNRWRPC